MTTSPTASPCRIISIASARPGTPPQPHSALALIRGQRAINLAELANSIRADRGLNDLVTDAACQEFGCPWLTLEQALVLLGGELLCAILSVPRRGRSAGQLRRAYHRNRIAPTQEEPR